MSHGKERHEKICLNCNAELNGRFCHVCGQENIEPKETVWGLVSHFFYDITHFDGKFFSTTKYLVTKPGFLPKEYIKGRRASYLHPIKMYVFSSAVFFLIFFSVFKTDTLVKGDWNDLAKVKDSLAVLDIGRSAALAAAYSHDDSMTINRAFDEARAKKLDAQKKADALEDAENARDSAKALRKDSIRVASRKAKKMNVRLNDNDDESDWGFGKNYRKYKTVAAYDSAQDALPEGQRDGWWKRRVVHRDIELKARYGDDNKKLMEELIDKFRHSFPYLLFVSLPLYALFMKLLYWRHKKFYYVEHGIFFIYLYIFTFVYLLVYYSIVQLRQATHWNWIGWIEFVLMLAGIYYAYKSMRNFYGQSRGMTILKFILLNIMAGFTLIMLFILFFTLSLYRL